MMVRLPGLLDASLAEVARLKPISGNLTIKMMGASEATLTIAEDDQAVTVHDWISLYTQRGFAGIFRVSNVAQTYKRQIELTLLHGIDVLADSVWSAQTDFSGTKTQYLTRLLNQQTHLINGQRPWVLGVCEDTETFERTINYDRLSTLLEELEEDGGDYYFTYDQTSFPWVLNYVRKPSGVTSEFRLSRNVQTATVTYNDSDLCTRLILSVNHRVEDSDTSTSSTDSAIRTYNNTDAQAIWGVVVKTADIDTSDDVAHNVFTKANKWAQKFLNKRAAPTVQIQIDGEELYYLTGDTWDEYSVGKICQTALPAYGHTFLERVVSVTYPALYAQSSRVTVSLANTLPKFSESISKVSKTAESAAASARGTARGAASAKDLTTWSQHVKYYGEALDGTGVLTLYESGIDMDAAGGVKIYSLVEGVQSLYAGIQVTANGIESLVSKTGVNSLGQNETLYSKITQNAGLIDLVVDNSGQQASIRIDAIVDDINSSGTSIKLNADKIYLNGQTIASVISATQANIDNLITGTTKATLINSDSVVGDTVTGGTVYATNQLSIGSSSSGGSGALYYRGTQYYRQALTLGSNGAIATAYVLGDASTAKSFDHYHAITATEGTGADAGKIILTLSDPIATSDTTHSTTNFNIAATTTYRNGVLAARNAVAVNPFTANVVTGDIPDHRTFTYTTNAPTPAAGTSQSDTWYLSGGTTWTNNKTNVGLHYGSASGTVYAMLEVDGSSLISGATYAGKASVKLTNPTWNEITSGYIPANRTVTVRTKGRTDASGVAAELSKSVAMYLTQGSWSDDDIMLVSLRSGSASGPIVAQTSVIAADLVTNAMYTGKSSVTLLDPTWNSISGSPPSNRTVTVRTNARTDASGTTENLSKSVQLYLTQGSWNSDNQLVVSMREGSTSGTVYAATTVDASTLVSDAETAARYAGKASVSLADPTWNAISGDITSSRTVTVRTTGRTNSSGTAANLSKEVALSLSASGRTVYLKHGSVNVAKVTCSDPDISLPSAATTSSTSDTHDKEYSVSKAYSYIRIKVTAGTKSKTIQIHLLSA